MKLSQLIFVACFLGVSSFGAETIVTKRINAQNRLLPPKKVTVGPDDQYHGSVDPSGQTLVFTKKSDLVPHVCSQDLKTGEVTDVLPLSADSQQPSFSPDGRIAFTFFKFNARGDICYRPLKGDPDDKMTCLKSDEGERSAPFWKSNEEIGYLVRNMKTLNTQIVVENIKDGSKQVLAEGKVWSPSMRPNGRYLFYNELAQGKRVLVMKDVEGKRTKVLKFALPGISGFPTASPDESHVFFSHYLNDTNNDNTIDGNDNSVIFRASIDGLWKNDEVFPEQLTSAESSCSFPRPHADQLFVTCAFEGSLDIYQVPATGIVPKDWNEPLLWNAHQTARSYEERILVLNTLKFRLGKVDNRNFDERLLSDHLLSDDASAAKYYIASLQTDATPEQKHFYTLVSLYLDGLEKKKAQTSNEVSRQFQADIMDIDARMEKVPGATRTQQLVRGLLRTFLNQPQQSMSFLQKVKFDTQVSPLQRYFYFELAHWTLPKVKSVESLFDIYRQMMTAPELTEESRLYYSFRALDHLHKVKANRQDRVDFLAKFNKNFPPAVTSLLSSESATLRIIVSKEESGKDTAYRDLDQLMSASRSDYFLRKAMYVRSILNFADAAEFKYLNFIATNWLRYTANEDTEFANARDAYVNASLDRAYDTFAQKKYDLASGYFYGSLSLTDDLESHYGYIVTMVMKNQRATVDERYKNLKDRNFIDDNMKFVEALLHLLDAKPGPRHTSHLDFAIERLTSMDQDRDSSVRYLMLGYCYLDKMTRTADGYDFDRDLFENAHRNLMLSYDIGRDNDRVKAAALMNLGILHQRVQNHGLAVKFFTRRKDLGFTSPEERSRFAWLFGRSLFYNHQPDKAGDELAAALKVPTKFQVPLEERQAFYLQGSGSYNAAIKAYQKLFAANAISGDLNLAKAHLSYGYSLMKAKKEKDARKALLTALQHAERLSVVSKGGDRLVDFQPLRLKLNAYGLLGRVGTEAERLDALEKRTALFDANKGFYDDQLTLSIQIRLQMAQLYMKKDSAKTLAKLREALTLAEQLGENGMYLSTAVYHTASAYLAYGFLHPELFKQEDATRINNVVDKTVQTYTTTSAKNPQPMLDYQKLKLQMLWTAFSAKTGKGKPDKREIKNLVEASTVKTREIDALAEALTE